MSRAVIGRIVLAWWPAASWCWRNLHRFVPAAAVAAALVWMAEVESDYDEIHVELAAVRLALHELQAEVVAIRACAP